MKKRDGVSGGDRIINRGWRCGASYFKNYNQIEIYHKNESFQKLICRKIQMQFCFKLNPTQVKTKN